MDTEKNQENYIGNALEYDYTKSITIEVNTAYIEALQRITRYFIMNVIEEVDKVPAMFNKFNKIIKDKKINNINVRFQKVEGLPSKELRKLVD